MNRDFTKKLIYIVDDEPELLIVLEEIIRLSLDVNIKTFSVPEEVLQSVQTGEIPNLFITDLKMPLINGLQLLEQIRALKIEKPAIIFSGNSCKNDAVMSLKLKVSGFLDKPVLPEELLQEVTNALAKEEIFSIYDSIIEKKEELIKFLHQFINKNLERVVLIEDKLFGFKNTGFDNNVEKISFLNSVKQGEEIDRNISHIQNNINDLNKRRLNLLTSYNI